MERTPIHTALPCEKKLFISSQRLEEDPNIKLLLKFNPFLLKHCEEAPNDLEKLHHLAVTNSTAYTTCVGVREEERERKREG